MRLIRFNDLTILNFSLCYYLSNFRLEISSKLHLEVKLNLFYMKNWKSQNYVKTQHVHHLYFIKKTFRKHFIISHKCFKLFMVNFKQESGVVLNWIVMCALTFACQRGHHLRLLPVNLKILWEKKNQNFKFSQKSSAENLQKKYRIPLSQ